MFASGSQVAGTGFDVCVVGAGPAGLSAALELARAGRSVLVLEAGSASMRSWTHPIPQDDLVADRPYRDVAIDGTRTHGFGGTIGLWSAAVAGGDHGARLLPFDPIDLADRPWVPHSGWPLSDAELARYVDSAHALLGVGAADYSVGRWSTEKFRPLEVAVSGFTTGMYHFADGSPALEAWRAELAAAAHVTVSVDTVAVKLLPGPDGRTVGSVAVVLPDGKRAEVSARRFVLAGGGIENPRLLLDSMVDGHGLAIDRRNVGRYFMDHPLVRAGTLELAPGRVASEFGLYDLREVFGATVMGHLKPTPALVEARNLLATAFLFYPRPARYRPAVMRHYRQLVEDKEWTAVARSVVGGPFRPRISDVRALVQLKRVGRAELGRGGWTAWPRVDAVFRSFEVLQQTEQPPTFDNRVELGERVDPLGRRAAWLVWHWTEQEASSVAASHGLLAQAIESAGVGRFIPERVDGAPAMLGGTHHHMGATRMSVDPAAGVVDSDGKVHGIDNLYVTGCSVFPTGGFQNPTVMMMALAVRLGRHLAARPV